MSPRNGAHASHVIDMLAPLCNRFVCISSASVYRTFGRLVGTEKAPIDNEPQTEAAPLRSKLYPYAGATPRAADDPRAWLDTYDKIPAEQAYLEEAAISVSIVRMPLLYGPGDPDTRVARFRLSMLAPAGRVILRRDAFGWRNSRCGIANAAEAVALVAERANGGEIYNVAEQEDYCEADWIGMIGSIIGWRGHLEPAHLSDPDGLPLEDIPIHADFSQHLRLDSGRIRQDLGYRESESPLAGLRKALGMAA
jgi:nucleoside-diphosphate-sugar epimerase